MKIRIYIIPKTRKTRAYLGCQKSQKSVNFRSITATGVYALPRENEIRFIFIGQEPFEIELQEERPPLITEGPHIQAELVLNRDLAVWLLRYLNEYLKPASEVSE